MEGGERREKSGDVRRPERLVLREAFKGEYSTYDVYSLTREGVNKLADLARSPRPPLMLFVPESVRALDQKVRGAPSIKRREQGDGWELGLERDVRQQRGGRHDR
eukprot:2798420-Pleurochrysis_carterae.AAC.1